MAKDQKGHGSEKHEQAWAKSQSYLKQAAAHEKSGNGRAAADARVKAREHAEEANYLRNKGKRMGYAPASNTPEPKYNPESVNKSIAASRPKIGAGEAKKIHALLRGREGSPVRSTTTNRKY